jgi:hypothetical protein
LDTPTDRAARGFEVAALAWRRISKRKEGKSIAREFVLTGPTDRYTRTL